MCSAAAILLTQPSFAQGREILIFKLYEKKKLRIKEYSSEAVKIAACDSESRAECKLLPFLAPTGLEEAGLGLDTASQSPCDLGPEDRWAAGSTPARVLTGQQEQRPSTH